jgi:anti-anti-sigma factor
MLTVTTERIGDVVTLHCKGRIVRGHETAILCKALGQNVPYLVLDLEQVDAIDAAGLGALVTLQAVGVYLKLMNPTERVKETLRLTHLDSIFELDESQPPSERNGSKQSGPSWSRNCLTRQESAHGWSNAAHFGS